MAKQGKSFAPRFFSGHSNSGSTSAHSRSKLSRPKSRGLIRTAKFESLEARNLMAADLLQLDDARYDANHLLVQFQPTSTPQALIGTSVAGATVNRQVSSDGWYRATLSHGADLNASLQAFRSRSDVVMAAPDFRVALTAVPNDPHYSSLWGLENGGTAGLLDADIDASEAWDYGTTSSVVVAVIDSGIDYNHVDLVSNIWTNTRELPGNGIDDDQNGYVDDIRGWNFVADNNNPIDDNGHGTHVAGTIGAVGDNGIGTTGVAWNAKLMALKFLDASGSGLLSDAVSAIDYARTNGAKIINASWGGGGFSSVLETAIQRFQSAGGIFVAAAGNEGSNNTFVASYPANYELPSIVSVAASTSSDALASFSNYGTKVDIAAPGQSILSTVPGNSYATYSGTSMATPHVAGAMALLWGQAPALTATQLIDLVLSNTDAVLKSQTIHGRLNIGKAAATLKGNATDKVSPFVTAASWNQSAGSLTSVDVTFSEAVKVTSLSAASIQISGPKGAVAIGSITPLNSGTQFRITFAAQSAAGKYALTILPTVTDLNGNLLNQDRDTIAGEATQDRFISEATIQASRVFTRNGPITLQDATSTRAGVTWIAIDVTESFTINDLNVNLSVDHTYVSDLRVRLIAPNGTSVQLVNRRGGSRDNLRVAFDDEATTSIAMAASDLNGTFRPETALSAFDGRNAYGRWTLEITDFARLDVGRFNNVSLQFNSGVSAATTKSANPTNGNLAAPTSMQGWLAYALDLFDARWRRRF